MVGVPRGKWRKAFQEMDEESWHVILTSRAMSDINVVKPRDKILILEDHSNSSVKK